MGVDTERILAAGWSVVRKGGRGYHIETYDGKFVVRGPCLLLERLAADHNDAIATKEAKDVGGKLKRGKMPARDDAYVAAALFAGRPTRACACRECKCELHAYAGACIWCRNGQHAAERRLKLKEASAS